MPRRSGRNSGGGGCFWRSRESLLAMQTLFRTLLLAARLLCGSGKHPTASTCAAAFTHCPFRMRLWDYETLATAAFNDPKLQISGFP
ncbi:hypothetical protein BD309DRAFT_678569 [Dichomitus squalens]|uniref:Uncharacterized protein n=1 Tax=Dichomitus squalens TaxID=114155 RepID=A0A4V2K4U9_9APHY|nr:uncharacterized protein DICSQDRAFT_154455 [Dichomitus squalens LYAD-421 SS1]EJF62620.1 hypothetical protein DICSQDRAFT_154455 [Dichomitus squalens LYAD-421 SS1]TBU45873.1 hypothetical protein BD309DRAFT_678569 [Dichomitus squalens]TBU60641.1 hypothetical protein BD310DRAFT_309147 [Dichomitus squalens]